MFHLPTRNKTSWMHPRSRHWHLIDYVIVRAKGRQDVRVTKAMCGNDCWTDHRLIISKMKFLIQTKKRPQGQKMAKKLNDSKLKNHQIAQELQSLMDSKLTQRQPDQLSIEDQWASFKDSTYSSALEVLGPLTRNHQDWFDENDAEIQKLLEEKHQLLRAHQNDPSSCSKKAAFNSIRRTVRAKLRQMQDD